MQRKKRINLEIEMPLFEKMEKIQTRIGAASLTELLRRSVHLMDDVSRHCVEKKGKFIYRSAAGKEEVVRFLL